MVIRIYVRPSYLLIKSWFIHYFVRGNLCDKVSKIKNLRGQFRRIFRWLRRGVLYFFCRPCFLWEICKTKWTLFILFRVASILHRFVLQISLWNQGLQKKWTTPRQSQRKILRNCHLNFLFLKLCHRDFLSQSNVNNHDFIKKSLKFSIFLEHP